MRPVCGCVCGVFVVFENCIVDASIFFIFCDCECIYLTG